MWLRLNESGYRCGWDSLTTNSAGHNGHLEVLKRTHADGCAWEASIFAHAASSGHLEILKWIRENGCPWNGSTCFLLLCKGTLN